MDVAVKVAFVTGASSGMGEATAPYITSETVIVSGSFRRCQRLPMVPAQRLLVGIRHG